MSNHLTYRPQLESPALSGVEGPLDWLQDILAARKARTEVEETLKREKEAEDRARQGMSWSQKADVFLAVAKVGVITIPAAFLALTLAPVIREAGTALKGTGEIASEGAKNLRAIRENPRTLSWKEKCSHLLSMKGRYWDLADAPAFGGTPEQWFFQGVGQGINDACLPQEQCFSLGLFRQTLKNRRELLSEAYQAGDKNKEAYHQGYWVGMKASVQYLSKPAYGPPQVAANT